MFTPKKILVTGSRKWKNSTIVANALIQAMDVLSVIHPNEVQLIHGGARGLDSIAAEVAAALNIRSIVAVPADWNTHGKAAGPIRNQQMVDMQPDICLAFPHKDSIGTLDCANRAKKANIPTYYITES